jgi:hypothetical protein
MSRPDLTIDDHGSVILLRAASPAGQAWVEEHVDRGGYQPFPGGTRIVESRYLGPIITGAREAGLVVEGRL